MAAITGSEVKNYILIQDTYVENESVSLSSRKWSRLAKKPNVTILRVSSGTTYGSTNKWTDTNFYQTTTDFLGYTLIKHATYSTHSATAALVRYVTYKYNKYDSDIALLIPQVEYDLCSYLNNWFEDQTIYVHQGSGLAFTKGTTEADKIVDDNQDFSTAGFVAGMDIVVRGGSNAGIHTLAAVSTAQLTLTSTGILVSQDQDVSYNVIGGIKISRIQWPQEIKPYLAQMVWYRLNRSKPDNVASERIDDYSVTYINGNPYPTETIKGLARFKKARLQ
jgi:hypothetical protein